MLSKTKFQVTKLDAARRQLKVAISLWFQSGDEVAIHTLAGAAYQIIHDINTAKKAGTLLFDSPVFKEEYRKEAINMLKRDVNFFKHADKEPDGVTEFLPAMSELFIMGATWGLQNLGLKLDLAEKIFHEWFCLQHPEFLTEKGVCQRANLQGMREFHELKKLSPHQFFNIFMQAGAQLGHIR
ncbi:MAG: hypothetical protein JWO08_991 [Verrucomicrobiaceae bacterium]|nr:hypothetical protein [Verrucomicrobiaceae bacterium]